MPRADDGSGTSATHALFRDSDEPYRGVRRTFKYPFLEKPGTVWRFPDVKAKRGGRQSALSHRRTRWLRELTGLP